MAEKTHYRKAFDSPYLSSADIVDPIILTIKRVALEPDRTNKTKDSFNTAHWVEREIRAGEPLKPMILNAFNCKVLRSITGSAFIDDWNNIQVRVYVDKNVKFGRDLVEGLRLSAVKIEKKPLTPEMETAWNNAKAAYQRDGNLDKVLALRIMTDEHRKQLIAECLPATSKPPVEGEVS